MPPKRSTRPSSAASTPRKRKAATKPTAAPPQGSALPQSAQALIRFIGLSISSLGLSTALFSLSMSITQGDLAWTSKHLDSWWQVAGLLAWRIVELGVYWILDYDAIDAGWLNFLAQIPTSVLLASFYNIRPTTILTVSAIHSFSIVTALHLFRPYNIIHTTPTNAKPFVIRDKLIALYTTVLATSIYTLAHYLSYATWIPRFLITHFDGLPDLRAAHEGAKGLLPMFLTFLLTGYAAREFLFVPSAGHPHADEPGPKYQERQSELFFSSLYRKNWAPLPAKTKVLVTRTFVMAAMVMANTVVQLLGTINGAELTGAIGWGCIWTAATVVVARVYAWIEAVD